MAGRLALRTVALAYLAALLVAPVAMVFERTFSAGLEPVWRAVSDPGFVHALELTLLTVAIAVPVNTVFGVACALVLVRHPFRGQALLSALVDIPFAVSPVVIGLSLYLLYGRTSALGSWLLDHGVQVIFNPVGVVLATIFISLPFVVRETVPVLREVGTEQEQAAATLGAGGWATFWRVTLPSIRWGVGYGIVLTTARVLGEFGAVSVVSGRLEGRTETLPLLVQDRYEAFDTRGAYTAAIALALLALLSLLAMTRSGRRVDRVGRAGPDKHETETETETGSPTT